MKSRLMAGPTSFDEEDKKIILDSISDNGWYGERYKYVEKFEKEFAEYHGRKHGLMTPNCTQALNLLVYALGIKKGDEVIVPESTWTGSIAAAACAGAIPVLCDVEEKNWCLNPDDAEKRLTEKTKAIIVVDLYGNMPNMNKLEKISSKYDIPIIEDAAEALGSKYNGVRAGKFGVGSVFSFHCTKTITCGEGGILLLDDDELYKKAKFYRDCGRSEAEPYKVLESSLKHMPSNPQAALVYAQFRKLEKIINKKREILHQYKEKLSDIPDLQFNEESDEVYNGVWATSLVFGKSHNITAEQVMKKLGELNLPTRPFFYPLSSLPAYSKYNTGSKEKNPVAYDISSRGITLPGALIMTEKDVDEYCDGIKKIFK
jgi:perosamine synthetase